MRTHQKPTSPSSGHRSVDRQLSVRLKLSLAILCIALLPSTPRAADQSGVFTFDIKRTVRFGAHNVPIDNFEFYEEGFGTAVTVIGDVDSNGFTDIAVGTPGNGSIHLLMFDEGAVVSSTVRVVSTSLAPNDGSFGRVLANGGDLDGNGVDDLLTSTADGVLILLLDHKGTVIGEHSIAAGDTAFAGLVSSNAAFASALASVGDLDGDGRAEIAIGAPGDTRVLIVFLDDGFEIAKVAAIDGSAPPFAHNDADGFGSSLATVAAASAGTATLAIGVPDADILPFGEDIGTLHVVRIDNTASVSATSEIPGNAVGLPNERFAGARHGAALAGVGDVDSDGNADLLVTGKTWTGAGTWILLLNDSGTARGGIMLETTAKYPRTGASRSRIDTVAAIPAVGGSGYPTIISGAAAPFDGFPTTTTSTMVCATSTTTTTTTTVSESSVALDLSTTTTTLRPREAECPNGSTVCGDPKFRLCGPQSIWILELAPARVQRDDTCGNGVLDAGEDCDDGNRLPNDCCSPDCGFESAGTRCAGDDNPCTTDTCDHEGNCEHNSSISGRCADAIECTSDRCDASGNCASVAVDSRCPADGACEMSASCDVASGCIVSIEENGTECTELTGCAMEGVCTDGECIATEFVWFRCYLDGQCRHCGAPVQEVDRHGALRPTATDALWALQASVGLVVCPPCICDLSLDLAVSAVDALMILNIAVSGDTGTLICPGAGSRS